jgi:hypothetical protein
MNYAERNRVVNAQWHPGAQALSMPGEFGHGLGTGGEIHASGR